MWAKRIGVEPKEIKINHPRHLAGVVSF